MWWVTAASDDDAIVWMCTALYVGRSRSARGRARSSTAVSKTQGGPVFIVVVSGYSHLELIMLYRVGNKSSAPARLSVAERFEKRGARLGIASTYNGCGQRSCL